MARYARASSVVADKPGVAMAATSVEGRAAPLALDADGDDVRSAEPTR